VTCLDDNVNFKNTDMITDDDKISFPGLIYDFNEQCKFSFGKNATHCKKKEVIYCKFCNIYTINI
jgi:hypothetical protein